MPLCATGARLPIRHDTKAAEEMVADFVPQGLRRWDTAEGAGNDDTVGLLRVTPGARSCASPGPVSRRLPCLPCSHRERHLCREC